MSKLPPIPQSKTYVDKTDAGKLRLSLMPWRAILRVAKVFAFGARKYAPHGWRSMPNVGERAVDAALRHLSAHLAGETFDPESGLPHLDHATASLLIARDE